MQTCSDQNSKHPTPPFKEISLNLKAMIITASLLTTEDNSLPIKSFHLHIENIMMNFLWECGRRTGFFFFSLPCSPNWVRVRKEEAVKLCPVFGTEQQRRQKKQELALVTVITLWLYNSIIFPSLINIHLQHLNHLHSRSRLLKISRLQTCLRLCDNWADESDFYVFVNLSIPWWYKKRGEGGEHHVWFQQSQDVQL